MQKRAVAPAEEIGLERRPFPRLKIKINVRNIGGFFNIYIVFYYY